MKSINSPADARAAGRAQAALFYAQCTARNMDPVKSKKEVLAWFKRNGAETMPLPLQRIADKAADEAWIEIIRLHRKMMLLNLFKRYGHWLAIAAMAGTLAALYSKLH